jgi:hypothetical protein
LKAKVGMQLQSHLLVMLKYYGTSSHQNWVIVEQSSRPNGSSKMVQLPTEWEHPWRSFRKRFRSTSFHCMVRFHGLRIRLSLPVIISFGGTSKWKCTPLDHGLSMTSRSQFGNKFQWYQETWWGEHWETCKQGWKSVGTMKGNNLVMCCSKQNKQTCIEMYVE